MGETPNVTVGQVWEDFEPIYNDTRTKLPLCQKRRFKVVEVFTKTDHVWDRRKTCTEDVDRQYAKLRITRLSDGTETTVGRTVTVRVDRMVPKKGGYRLIEEAF